MLVISSSQARVWAKIMWEILIAQIRLGFIPPLAPKCNSF